VLGELKKKLEKEPDSYDIFWNNYGPVLKEGLCEAVAPRQELLEVCRFHSTVDTDALTTLDSYINRMKDSQPDIYYLCTDGVEEGAQNPILEGFLKRGIEVLLFTDTVDDFWVNVVHEFKGKKLVSVTRSGIDFGWDTAPQPASGDATEAENTGKVSETLSEEAIATLAERLKSLYGELVWDVRPTGKLLGTPAVLTVQEGQMDLRMERFLYENKQLISRIPKVLEINPSHPVVTRLSALAGSNPTLFTDAAWLLLDQAMVIAGEEVPNPGAFAKRLTHLLEQTLGQTEAA
jgi:molecular chaperone HtpG